MSYFDSHYDYLDTEIDEDWDEERDDRDPDPDDYHNYYDDLNEDAWAWSRADFYEDTSVVMP
jgi:hypothetical protein